MQLLSSQGTRVITLLTICKIPTLTCDNTHADLLKVPFRRSACIKL